MATEMYNISLGLIYVFNIVLFLVSLIFCFRNYNPTYLKTLPIYCFVNLLVEIISKAKPQFMHTAYSVFTLFELLYFSYILSKILYSKFVKNLVWFLNGIFGVLFIYHVIKSGQVANYSPGPVLFESLILIIPCLTYFREIFKQPSVMNLCREPSFWMVTGILFYFVLLIPTLWFTNYYAYVGMNDIANAFYSINNYSQIISFTLFIKAMTCKRKISY